MVLFKLGYLANQTLNFNSNLVQLVNSKVWMAIFTNLIMTSTLYFWENNTCVMYYDTKYGYDYIIHPKIYNKELTWILGTFVVWA